MTACWAASSSSLSIPDNCRHTLNYRHFFLIKSCFNSNSIVQKLFFNELNLIFNYLQRIPQTHIPTTQNKSLRCWGWPVSCRSPTLAAIQQTSLQGSSQIMRTSRDCELSKSVDVKSLTSPCCGMEFFPPDITKQKHTDVNLRQSVGGCRSAAKQAHQGQHPKIRKLFM